MIDVSKNVYDSFQPTMLYIQENKIGLITINRDESYYFLIKLEILIISLDESLIVFGQRYQTAVPVNCTGPVYTFTYI